MANSKSIGPNMAPTDQSIPTSPAHQDPARSVLSGWTVKALIDLGALDIPGRDCIPGDLHRIHPMFRRSNCRMGSDVYTRIIPALCLASAFLYEPQASAFWYSIVFGPRQPIPHLARDSEGMVRENSAEPWSRFSAVPVGIDEWRELDSFWEQMGRAITIRFADMDVDGGQTVEAKWERSYPPGPLLLGGVEAVITLSTNYRTISRRFATPAPTASLPHWLRQHHLIAVTLLHEVCHAIHMVRTQVDAEPFFEDHRQAELGYAWEQSVLNGQVDPVAVIKHTHNTIYGLHFSRWPHRWRPENARMLYKWPLAEMDDYVWRVGRRHWETKYLVTMDYVQALVKSREWQQIARYGPERLKMVKRHGLRHGIRGSRAWQDAGSSGASSQFDSVEHTLWPVLAGEPYSFVRRPSPPPKSDSDTDSNDEAGDPMDIDEPEDNTNKNKRRRSSSDSGGTAPPRRGRLWTDFGSSSDPKRPRLRTGPGAGPDPKRPRLSDGGDCIVY